MRKRCAILAAVTLFAIGVSVSRPIWPLVSRPIWPLGTVSPAVSRPILPSGDSTTL